MATDEVPTTSEAPTGDDDFEQELADRFTDAYRTAYAMALAAERGDEAAVGDLWRSADHDAIGEAVLVLALAQIPGQVMRLVAMGVTGKDNMEVDAEGILSEISEFFAAGGRFGEPLPPMRSPSA
jgi:hypothetical protein